MSGREKEQRRSGEMTIKELEARLKRYGVVAVWRNREGGPGFCFYEAQFEIRDEDAGVPVLQGPMRDTWARAADGLIALFERIANANGWGRREAKELPGEGRGR
jgi:hypothetical protein